MDCADLGASIRQIRYTDDAGAFQDPLKAGQKQTMVDRTRDIGRKKTRLSAVVHESGANYY
jgi:hypothetical protein